MIAIKIRIGTGSGCAHDRIEPAEELILKGNIDYLVFECLSEKSMADSMAEKLKDGSKGYNSMLEERRSFLCML